MGAQHAPSLGVAAEMVPIEVRPAVFPVTGLFSYAQNIALSISFTYQLVSESPGVT
jgi:hypothetical protein